MKKKYVLLLVVVIIFVMFGGFIKVSLMSTSSKETNKTESVKKTKSSRSLSMMLETGAGTGIYEATTRSTWPTDGYVFNTELSKCENGSKLSWDVENNKVIMTGNVSDKCYVYFDVYSLAVINSLTEETTSSSIKLMVNATSGTEPISKYYYSKDNGITYIESTSNTYTFSGLTANTTYNIKVYVIDENGKSSEVYSKSINIIAREISFYINNVEYKALDGMTWEDWGNSEYYVDVCRINSFLYCKGNDGTYKYYLDSSVENAVLARETIIENYYYTHQVSGPPHIS